MWLYVNLGEFMAKAEVPKGAIYVELEGDLWVFIERCRKAGLTYAEVVRYALSRLMDMDFERFILDMFGPKAKEADLVSMFKGKKKEVEE